jgi:hypothetical protein
MSTTLGIIASSRQQSAPLLLDTYPNAAAAYSLRKLRSSYSGFCIQVRRSSDNTTQNIGFNIVNKLDTTALLSFVGSSSGFITKWYDQTTNVKDAVQATNANQPRIVLNGTIEVENGLPKIVFETMFLSVPQVLSSDCFIAYVGNSKLPLAGGVGFITYNSSPNDNPELFLGINDGFLTYFNGGICVTTVAMANTYSVFNFLSANVITSITNSIYRNNIFQASGTRTGIWATNFNEFTIGKYVRTGATKNGQIQELIIYNSNQSTNRTGINTNINSYYSIY